MKNIIIALPKPRNPYIEDAAADAINADAENHSGNKDEDYSDSVDDEANVTENILVRLCNTGRDADRREWTWSLPHIYYSFQ